MNALFDDTFFAAVGRLGLDVRPAPPREAAGMHLSRRGGQSLHFRDYQAYAPGDDLRRVDWSVYGRTRHLFVRRFERPVAVPVYLVADASASMRLATAERFTAAARACGAVAAAAVAAQNPVRLVLAGAAPAMPRALTGRAGLMHVLTALSAAHDTARDTDAAGDLSPAALIEQAGRLLASRPPGVLVIASDFFEDRGIDALIEAARLLRHRLVLVRLIHPADREPALSADADLIDAETGRRISVADGAAALAQVRAAYDAYFGALDRAAATRGDLSVPIDVTADLLTQLAPLFPDGTLRLPGPP